MCKENWKARGRVKQIMVPVMVTAEKENDWQKQTTYTARDNRPVADAEDERGQRL